MAARKPRCVGLALQPRPRGRATVPGLRRREMAAQDRQPALRRLHSSCCQKGKCCTGTQERLQILMSGREPIALRTTCCAAARPDPLRLLRILTNPLDIWQGARNPSVSVGIASPSAQAGNRPNPSAYCHGLHTSISWTTHPRWSDRSTLPGFRQRLPRILSSVRRRLPCAWARAYQMSRYVLVRRSLRSKARGVICSGSPNT